MWCPVLLCNEIKRWGRWGRSREVGSWEHRGLIWLRTQHMFQTYSQLSATASFISVLPVPVSWPDFTSLPARAIPTLLVSLTFPHGYNLVFASWKYFVLKYLCFIMYSVYICDKHVILHFNFSVSREQCVFGKLILLIFFLNDSFIIWCWIVQWTHTLQLCRCQSVFHSNLIAYGIALVYVIYSCQFKLDLSIPLLMTFLSKILKML